MYKTEWPKTPTNWIEKRTLYVSVPFTWNLPEVKVELQQRSFLWDSAIVGGPAVELMPAYLTGIPNVTVGGNIPGVLQRVNPQATRTSLGCIRRCRFCGIGRGLIEPGGLRELADWPDLPVICDNNLLATTMPHFHRVIDRLCVHGWADFNQGLDARLLTIEHARRIAEIGKPIVRLALDSWGYKEAWENAVGLLRIVAIPKRAIRTYCLIGFGDGPDPAWKRCEYVQSLGLKAYPMWYHGLDQLEANIVTEQQQRIGWTEALRLGIMGYYYKHRGKPLCKAEAE